MHNDKQQSAVTEAIEWLRECSTWMLSNDLDMTCPMETDPLDIADRRSALANIAPEPVDELVERLLDAALEIDCNKAYGEVRHIALFREAAAALANKETPHA